jgi:hypothetical protein
MRRSALLSSRTPFPKSRRKIKSRATIDATEIGAWQLKLNGIDTKAKMKPRRQHGVWQETVTKFATELDAEKKTR